MDASTFKNASEHVKSLLNCVNCPNCNKLIKEPQTGVCQHNACARCWGSSNKICTVCKKPSGTKLHPNIELAACSEAVTKLIKAFHKVSGINVEEYQSSKSTTPDKDSDCFIEKDMEYNNLKTYKNNANKSDELKSISQVDTPLIFAGEEICQMKEEVVNISKKDKVEGWLKSSENVFLSKVTNDEIKKSAKKNISPLNKKNSQRSFKQKDNLPNSISLVSIIGKKSDKNFISDPKSDFDDISQGVIKKFFENALPEVSKITTRKFSKENKTELIKPSEKENKRVWQNVKKAKKMLKKSRNSNSNKLNISFETVDNASKSNENIPSIETSTSFNQSKTSEVMMRCQVSLEEVIPVVELNSSKSNSPIVDNDSLALQKVLELSKLESIENPNKYDESLNDNSNIPITHLVSKKSSVNLSDIKNVINSIENEVVSVKINQERNTNFDDNGDSQMIDKALSKLDENDCKDDSFTKENKDDEAISISISTENNQKHIAISCKNNVPFVYHSNLSKKSKCSYKPDCNEKSNHLQKGYNLFLPIGKGKIAINLRYIEDASIYMNEVRDAQTSPIPNPNENFVINKNQIENASKNTQPSISIASSSNQAHDFHITESIEKEMAENNIVDLEDENIFLTKFSSDPEKQTIEPISKHVSEILQSHKRQRVETMNKSMGTNNCKIIEGNENKSDECKKKDFNSSPSIQEIRKRPRIDENSFDVISPNPSKKQKSQYEIPLDDNMIVNFQSQTEDFNDNLSIKHIENNTSKLGGRDSYTEIRQKELTERDKKIQLLKQSLAIYDVNEDEKSKFELDIEKEIENFDSDFECNEDFSADVVEDTPQKIRTVERLLKKKTNNSNLLQHEDEFTSICTPPEAIMIFSQESNSKDKNLQNKQSSSHSMSEKKTKGVLENSNKRRSSEKSPRTMQTRSMNTPSSLKRFTSNIKYRSTPTQPLSRRTLQYPIDENIPVITETTEINSGSSFQKSINAISNNSINCMEDELVEQALKSTLAKEVCISCSCLTLKQKEFVKLFADQMNWAYTDDFNNHVTHLIVKVDSNNQCQRSLKYIQSVAAGCWIVSWQWIRECMNTQSHVKEDAYEVLDSSGEKGPYRSRVADVKLFSGMTFFADSPFSHMTEIVFKEILTKAGGKVVKTIDEVKITDPKKICILLAEPDNTQDDRYEALCMTHPIVPVNIEWFLESLGKGKIESISDWLLCLRTLLPPLDWPKDIFSDEI